MKEIITYRELTKERLDKIGTVYWGPPGEERYSSSDIEEVIEMVLDHAHPGVPGTITVVAMSPRIMTAKDVSPDTILENTLEYLDEEYGDPDGDHTDPTPAMGEAAQKLAEVIARDYEVWICDEVLRVELDKEDIATWLKVNP
jgi:hypothetical protein